MVKGKIKEDIDSSKVLELTNGGYDIYKYYLGKVGKTMSRPWGKPESKMSWGIKPTDNVWFWRDFATEDKGNAITFVQKYFGLDFSSAMKKICWDFGLGGSVINVNPVVVTWDKPDIEKEYSTIGVMTKPFDKKHHEFWNKAGVSEEYCRKYNCFAVNKLAINSRFIPIKKDEIVFGYWAPEEDSWKIYFPERVDRFRNNTSGNHIWYLPEIPCDNLFICKSNKDAIVMSSFGLCVCATQNEGIHSIDNNIEKLNSVANTKYIVFGNDKQGWDMSYRITNKYNWKYFNIPQKELEKRILDPYDYCKAYGKNKLEQLLKLKKLI